MANSIRELLIELDKEGVTGAKRYNQVQRFISMKARKKRIPVSGLFELTPLCNLDCKMCYVHLEKEQMKGAQLLPISTWIDLAQQAIDAGMLYAQITGGECLTHPGFKEFYLFLRSQGIEVTVKSNGLLIKDDLLQFFIDNPPAVIEISVYGASDDGYESVTGHRVFNQVLDNVLRIKEANIPVSISVTPSAFMTDGEEILELLHKNGLFWNVNPSLRQPLEETGRDLLDAPLSTYLKIFRKSYALNGFDISTPCSYDSLPDSGGDANGTATISCAAGRGIFAINWRGEIMPCVNFPDCHHDVIALGFNNTWEAIGKELSTYPAPVECNGCVYQKVCNTCVAAHASNPQKGHVDPRICNWTKYMVSEGFFSLD